MFASVSRRLTIWYVTAAVVLVSLVMTALAMVVLVFYGHVLEESIEANSVEAVSFSTRALERHEPFARAALEFELRSHRSGIHIFAFASPRQQRVRPTPYLRTTTMSIPLRYGMPPTPPMMTATPSRGTRVSTWLAADQITPMRARENRARTRAATCRHHPRAVRVPTAASTKIKPSMPMEKCYADRRSTSAIGAAESDSSRSRSRIRR